MGGFTKRCVISIDRTSVLAASGLD